MKLSMNLLVGLLLLIIFFLRLSLYLYNYPDLISLDPSLEYLVSSHIISYGEFPLVGPTGSNGTVDLNSPLYYYALAIPLLVYKSIFTLNFVNILLQGVMGLTIYLLIKRLFGLPSALLAVFFVSFSYCGMKASQFFFQPFLSQPIFFLSLYALLKAYEARSFRMLVASIFLYILATSFYLSPLLYLPFYLWGILVVLAYIKRPKYRYVLALGIATLAFLLSFGGVFVSQTIVTPTVMPLGYSDRLKQWIELYQYLLFPSVFIPRSVIFLAVGLLSWRQRKSYWAGILLVCAFIPLIVFPLVSIGVQEHYLHLAGIFALLYIAVVIGKTFFEKPRWYIAGVVTSLCILYNSSNAFHFSTPKYYQTAVAATDAILAQIPDVSFEFIRAQSSSSFNQDWLFWHLLEEKTGKKYVSIKPTTGIPIVPNNSTWVFLTCEETAPDCTSRFAEKEGYLLEHIVFETPPFTIFLMKRAENEQEFVDLGDLRFRNQSFQESEEAFGQALSINPENESALNGLANIRIKQNRLEEAKGIFEKIHSSTGLGRIAYLTGDYNTAERLFLQSKSYFDLGKLYRILRRHDESEAAFSKALAEDPTNTGMLFGLGYLYMQYREFDKAITAFEKAIVIDPENDSVYSGLGDVYLRMRQYDKSEAMFQKALSINPNSDLFIGLGELYTETDRFNEAEAILKKGLMVNPKPDRYLGLGNFYLRVKRYDEAIPMFEKTIEMNPQSNGYIGLGSVYIQQNKFDLAEETFKKCLDTPYKAQAWLALGNLYMNTERYEEAETMLQKAITDEEVTLHAQNSLENLHQMLYDKTTL